MGDVDKIRHSLHLVKYLRVENPRRHYWDLLSAAQIEDIQQEKPYLFVKRTQSKSRSKRRLHGTWMLKDLPLRVGILLTQDTRSFLASFGETMSMVCLATFIRAFALTI